jgi:hypothetical protein
MNVKRRTFLKLALAASGAAALGYLGYDIFAGSKPANTGNTTTTSQISSSTISLDQSPLAVKDLQPEISVYNSDLTAFVNGRIDQSMIQNAKNLRTALRNYSPKNRETEGQTKRLDQLALSGLLLYSWALRLQQPDVNAVMNSKYYPPNIILAASRIIKFLTQETSPSKQYLANIGKYQTDVSTEHFIAPPLRPEFATLYNSLDQDTRAQLKQAFESYNPNADSIQDFKQITEEHIWVTSMNGLLKWPLDNPPADLYNKDVKTIFENGIAKKSNLGMIANAAYYMLSRRFYANKDGYAQDIDSAFSELPLNHKDLDDYDFALAIMNTPTFLALRKQIDFNSKDYHFLPLTFSSIISLNCRNSYTLSVFSSGSPYGWGSDIMFNGRYYDPDYWGADYGPPRLFDISNQNFGYGGFRKNDYFVVTKSILSYLNAIPALIYVPGKGVVINQ